MRILKTFFRTAVLSSLSPTYYNDILKVKTRFSVKYFIALQGILSVLAAFTLLVSLARIDVSRIVSSVVSLFPVELAIRANQQGVSINQPLPYAIPFPGYSAQDNPFQTENLIVFDKEGAIQNISDLHKKSTLIAVTQTQIYALKNANEMSVIALPKIDQSVEITRQMFYDIGQRITNHPFVKQKMYVYIAALIVIPAFFIITLATQSVTLFFFTLLAWVISKFLTQARVSFWTAYRLSLHSITPVVVLSAVLEYLHKPYIRGWVYLALYLAWTLVCFRAIHPPQKASTTKKKS